jgi:steroid 5-alpha reductase family enzyme
MIALLTTAALLVTLFAIAWWWATRIDNYSIVDAFWALSFVPVAAIYAWLGEGWLPRRIVIGGLLAAWGLRLGLHLSRRIAGHHPEEDRRYGMLRDRWSGKSAFLLFFLGQGLLVWLLTLPVYLICSDPTSSLQWLEVIGFAVWFIGLLGESIADQQLKDFARNSDDKKAVCKVGLWKYSRHPNYFFQSLLWWGLFLAALASPNGWLAILAPLAMLYTLLRVTGIPLTEKLSLKKRGENYRRYQETTSAFLPLPPKKIPSS